MSKLEYQHKKGSRNNNYAISFCLYKSDKFDYNKHIIPFENFLKDGGQQGFDTVLFYKNEEDLTDVILNDNNIRLFKITSDEKNYDRHLWRYLGCIEDYEWTWFRGMDTPKIPKREVNLQYTAHYSGCDMVIWSRPSITCMGKCCVKKGLAEKLIKFLRNIDISDNLSKDWNCDEKLLSVWVNTGEQKILLALDDPTIRNPHQEEWLINRFRSGNHTVVVKDRDDRIKI